MILKIIFGIIFCDWIGFMIWSFLWANDESDEFNVILGFKKTQCNWPAFVWMFMTPLLGIGGAIF